MLSWSLSELNEKIHKEVGTQKTLMCQPLLSHVAYYSTPVSLSTGHHWPMNEDIAILMQ